MTEGSPLSALARCALAPGALMLGALTLGALTLAACAPEAIPQEAPVYDREIGALLERRCAECHAGDAGAEAAAGWAVRPYLGAIGCLPDEGGARTRPATLPADSSAPLLSALSRADHGGLLDREERDLLERWVSAGAPARRGSAHPASFVDPRAPGFHGRALREERWARMLEPDRLGACARCHAGSPISAGPEPPAVEAATPCTSCHAEPEGALACGTCHGSGSIAHPPRDPCFHPEELGRLDGHAPHVEAGLTCAACHPPRAARFEGDHGNGAVELFFEPALAGEGGSYEPSSGACAVGCHMRGGDTPEVSWGEPIELGCGGCHGAPPEGHDLGGCDLCHAEASAAGDALFPGPLHVNGRVDLGDGGGGCGACHGAEGSMGGGIEEAWPATGAHLAHRDSAIAEVACGSCHEVPAELEAPSHLDGALGAELTFGAVATAGGLRPRYEAGRCAEVACHGAGLGGGTLTEPRWEDPTGAPGECGSCHGLPPPAPHTASTSCASVICHGGEVRFVGSRPEITESGRLLHINGVADHGGSGP